MGDVRNAALMLTIIVLALWELAMPRRDLRQSTYVRWPSNFGIALLNGVAARALTPLTAMVAKEHSFGLLNAIDVPSWVTVAAVIVALDLYNYVFHVVTHSLPVLWWLHTVHHADLDVDFTTGLRHHPGELLVGTPLSLMVTALLGAPPAAVIIHQVIDTVVSTLAHANVRLPASAEHILGKVFVTPDMHRMHHSAAKRETNSNYGSIFSAWDRIFATYCAPATDPEAIVLGLDSFSTPHDLRLHRLLLLPVLAAKAIPESTTNAIPA